MNKEPKNQPKPTTNLLDEFSPEDLQKVRQFKDSKTDDSVAVDGSWMAFTEFGLAFGWDAYVAARDSKIPYAEFQNLLACKRKLDALRQYELAEAILIGTGSVNSKKPHATFKKLTKHLIKRMKVK